jgi:outer membrane protein OmpA-like peptidoglycan-associated protein
LGLVFLLPATAFAAPQKACPPLGSLPDFVASESVLRAFDEMEFPRKGAAGAEPETFVATGRTCVTSYALKEGKDAPSNLEIQMNYTHQLQAMGAEIVSSGGRDTYAHLVKAGIESWMRVYSSETTIETTVLDAVPAKLTLLPPSGSDYRLVGHLPNFVAGKPATKNFDSIDFMVTGGEETKTVQAQGRTVIVGYTLADGKPVPSNPEIRFNYREALRAQGAEILHDAGRDLVARLLDPKSGQVIWIGVYCSESSVQVSALEEKPFTPVIQPAAMQVALQKAGRVVLYVNFDFDRATLRPDAAPVVAQVVAMLKAEPGLRLGIEGHTDAMGTAERNRTLSGERARAFAAAMVAQGIAADRLLPSGLGPDKPLASNETSEGRARNRRVELVRM